jgi:hypothetical protein
MVPKHCCMHVVFFLNTLFQKMNMGNRYGDVFISVVMGCRYFEILSVTLLNKIFAC